MTFVSPSIKLSPQKEGEENRGNYNRCLSLSLSVARACAVWRTCLTIRGNIGRIVLLKVLIRLLSRFLKTGGELKCDWSAYGTESAKCCCEISSMWHNNFCNMQQRGFNSHELWSSYCLVPRQNSSCHSFKEKVGPRPQHKEIENTTSGVLQRGEGGLEYKAT